MLGLYNVNNSACGDGNQTRRFCYVDDLIEGIIEMMECRENFVGHLNLGNSEEFAY